MNITSIVQVVANARTLTNVHGYVETGVYQLTNTLHSATFSEFGNELVYKNENNDFTISLHDHRLVKQPGFTIFISDVEDVYFYVEEQLVYMDLTMDNYQTTFLIGSHYET